MICEDLKFDLSFYLEDELTADERLAVEEHLSVCPLCRAELAQYRELSQDFKSVTKPQISDTLVRSIQSDLRVELALSAREPNLSFGEKFQNWLRPHLLPYGVGTFASLTLFALLALGIMLPANGIRTNDQAPYARSGNILNNNDEVAIAALKYASERSDVAQESPSLNPNGALVAMTAAMAKSGARNGEIVLVADVFSDGIARISEVVQPAPDDRTMRELEKAMEQEVMTSPAFVPADLDKRSDVVQIVLKIHEVEVRYPEKRPARKSRLKL
jgi:hypothetical protein